MQPLEFPVTKILLPYDGSPAARNALSLAGHLSLGGGPAVTGITLLQVMGGSYLARHVQNVDLRVTRLVKNKDWERLRQGFLEREVLPLLEEAREHLQSLGVEAPIDLRVLEGKVSAEILRLAQEEGYSTIVMGRRGLSPLKALFLGSVTRGVLSRAEKVTVYVAPQEAVPRPGGPVFPILLPVDGSEFSLAAVRQAAALAQAFRPSPPCLTLFHVIDLALVSTKLPEEVQDLVKEGEEILAAARRLLEEAGMAGTFEEKLVTGDPSQAIIREAQEGGFSLILMGSRGRSALSRLLLGSVTSNVVHTVTQTAVAVVYA